MALGQPLDASQPDVLSAPAADYAAAEQTFLSWVAPDKEATKVEGGYDYNLTSADGQAQGSVSFRAEEGDARVVARMTVTEGTALKQIREFEFLEHPTPILYFRFGLEYLPTEPLAQKVLDFYNNNTEFWNNMLDVMESKGYKWKPSSDTWATGNSEFIINAFWETPIIGTDTSSVMDLDEDQGEFCTVSSVSLFFYRYMHIKTFPAL